VAIAKQATAKQAAALERARAALAEKRETAKADDLDVLATRVEILWTERENRLARQQLARLLPSTV
jgi:hypothetical protein